MFLVLDKLFQILHKSQKCKNKAANAGHYPRAFGQRLESLEDRESGNNNKVNSRFRGTTWLAGKNWAQTSPIKIGQLSKTHFWGRWDFSLNCKSFFGVELFKSSNCTVANVGISRTENLQPCQL